VFVKILQKLCRTEESHVREQAAKCLTLIAKEMSIGEVQQYLSPFVLDLSQDQWFTGRLSACTLIPAAYRHFPKNKALLKQAFFRLCADKMPLVRRAAAMSIGELARSVEAEILENEVIS